MAVWEVEKNMQNDNPETVEAQWEPDVEVIGASRRWVKRDRPDSSLVAYVPLAVEAAIRAPLEERIRELEAERDEIYLQGFRDGGHEPSEAVEEYQRQNAKLREALIWMSGSAEFGPGQPAHDYWVEIRDTLLFPTSSTEKEDLNTPN